MPCGSLRQQIKADSFIAAVQEHWQLALVKSTLHQSDTAKAGAPAAQTALITDEQRLIGAKSRFGHAIAIYDDGYGPLFIHRDSMGISGIVRAQSWEDAYEICEDEFFPAGDEEAAIEYALIEATPEGSERNHLQACYDEAFGFRGNGRAEKDGTISYVYAKDLNGDSLDKLTPELLAHLEIALEIESEDK